MCTTREQQKHISTHTKLSISRRCQWSKPHAQACSTTVVWTVSLHTTGRWLFDIAHFGKQPPQQPNQREKLARSQNHCNTAILQQRGVGDACGCRTASVPHAVQSGVTPTRVQLIAGGAKGGPRQLGYFDSAENNTIGNCFLLHRISKSRFSGQQKPHRIFSC